MRCTSPAPKPGGFGLRLRAKRKTVQRSSSFGGQSPFLVGSHFALCRVPPVPGSSGCRPDSLKPGVERPKNAHALQPRHPGLAVRLITKWSNRTMPLGLGRFDAEPFSNFMRQLRRHGLELAGGGGCAPRLSLLKWLSLSRGGDPPYLASLNGLGAERRNEMRVTRSRTIGDNHSTIPPGERSISPAD
jgi:hypothetical protein